MRATRQCLTNRACRAGGIVSALLLAGCVTYPDTGATPAAPVAAAGPVLETSPSGIDSFDTGRGPGEAPALDTASLGEEIALRALALVGKPYRYGGADLEGFDCSGMVYYIYHQLGIDVPRTAHDQQREAMRIKRRELLPGDLVFFKLRHNAISHVGVYVGDNRFVHAPQSGKAIELRALDDHYFAARWAAAGRFD